MLQYESHSNMIFSKDWEKKHKKLSALEQYFYQTKMYLI